MTITSTKKATPRKAAPKRAAQAAAFKKAVAALKNPTGPRKPAGSKLHGSARLLARLATEVEPPAGVQTSIEALVRARTTASPKWLADLVTKAAAGVQTPIEATLRGKPAVGVQTSIEAALRARARRELGSLDYIRSVRVAVQDLGQVAVARALRVSQPSISKLLAGAEARGVEPVRDGFSGAGPYEIAERYAAGDIDRLTMIRELSTWPYVKNEGAAAAAAEWESTPYVDTPGSFAEVGRAFDEGLIDGDAYDQILDSDEVTEVQ